MEILKENYFEEKTAEKKELTRDQLLQVLKVKLKITLQLLSEFQDVEKDLRTEIFSAESDASEEDKQSMFKQ